MPPDAPETWHYGLMARWWAEFNQPEPEEVEYLRNAIERFGQPALDLGCGTGRLLTPLLAESLDVDGVDVSADMLAYARRNAEAVGASPLLMAQPMHRLDLPRRYRAIFMIGAFELAGDRDQGRETIRRAYAHLEPAGALIVNHELPYHSPDEHWARWLADRRADLPRPWHTVGRHRTADGDEIELRSRLLELDPLEQTETLESRLVLWRAGEQVAEESWRLRQAMYFPQEVLSLLRGAGFGHIEVESGYTGRPAVPDDGTVTFVARKVPTEPDRRTRRSRGQQPNAEGDDPSPE